MKKLYIKFKYWKNLLDEEKDFYCAYYNVIIV